MSEPQTYEPGVLAPIAPNTHMIVRMCVQPERSSVDKVVVLLLSHQDSGVGRLFTGRRCVTRKHRDERR